MGSSEGLFGPGWKPLISLVLIYINIEIENQVKIQNQTLCTSIQYSSFCYFHVTVLHVTVSL